MKYLFLFVALFFSIAIQAQQPAKPTQPVKLITRLGNVPTGNTGIEILKRIVDSTLNVTDTKGLRYEISSFTVNYFFVSTYLDEETQQKKQLKELRSLDFFDTDRLSEDWSNSIKDNVQLNDVLLINKIIVRMKNGKKMMAPDLKYTVMY